MPQYKLTDYTFPTAGELARAIMDYAGVQYEDIRVDKDKVKEAEKAAPFGVLPTLEVDGKVIAQHQSMCRYLAREHGLAGKNNKEAAMCDLIMDGLWSMFAKMRRIEVYQMPREQRLDIIKKMAEEDVPKYLDYYERLLKKREDENGYSVGKDLTWSDFGLTLAFAALQFRHGVSLDNHQLLKNYLNKMMEVPAISEFLAKRAQAGAGY